MQISLDERLVFPAVMALYYFVFFNLSFQHQTYVLQFQMVMFGN